MALRLIKFSGALHATDGFPAPGVGVEIPIFEDGTDTQLSVGPDDQIVLKHARARNGSATSGFLRLFFGTTSAIPSDSGRATVMRQPAGGLADSPIATFNQPEGRTGLAGEKLFIQGSSGQVINAQVSGILIQRS